MRTKGFIFFFLFIICLRTEAGFLDKKYYLVDSLSESAINKETREIIDGNLKTYHQAKSDSIKIECLKNITENVLDENIWIKYNRLLYNFAKNNQEGKTGRELIIYKKAEALAINNFGYFYFNYTSNFALAEKYYRESLLISESLQDYNQIVETSSNLANVYQNKGDLMQALEGYRKALSFESQINDKKRFIAPLNNVAQVYLYLHDTVNALKNLKKCLAISSQSDDKNMRAHLLHNIGIISYNSGEGSGVQTMKNALALRKQIGDKKGIVQSCLTLSGIARVNLNVLMAKEYLEEGRLGLVDLKSPALEGLYYNMSGRISEFDGDKEKAIEMYTKSINVFKQFSLGPELNEVLLSMIRICGNDSKHALKKLEAFELMQQVSERLNKENLQRLMLRQKFEEDLKVQEAVFKAEEKVIEEKNRSEKRRQQYLLLGTTVILLLTIIFSFFIYKGFLRIKQNNKIISEQKHLIEEKHKDITDSINYAQRIQSALIISEEKLKKNLKETFVIFKPRDIVSGDFYWYTEHKGYKIIALADCTGHGVPGAFMSMIGITLLNQIVNEKGITSPAKILNNLRKEVISALNTDATDKRDGMDIAIIAFNDNELYYSGANSQALMLDKGSIVELKPNKQPIGFYEKQEDFTEQKIEITDDLKLYLFSDGIVDQFGGEKGKKVKTRQLKEWLLLTSTLNLNAQKKVIETNLDKWKFGFEQTDDMCLIGVKLS